MFRMIRQTMGESGISQAEDGQSSMGKSTKAIHWGSEARTIPAHGFTQEAVHVLQAVDLTPLEDLDHCKPLGPFWWLMIWGEQTHKTGHNMS